MVQKRGFTLIELLVVIAIIGLLSTLAIVALGTARLKSRDARRVADLKSIQTALELYNSDNGFYPASSSIQIGDANHACLNQSGFGIAGCTNPYIATIPKDPSGGYYLYTGSGNDYAVSAALEGSVNGLSKAVAATQNSGVSNYNFSYGLVGYWAFDEGSGASAFDGSGFGSAGALQSNPQWVGGKLGSALSFNGSNNVSVPDSASLRLADNFTISLWVNLNNQNNAIFFNKGSSVLHGAAPSYGFGGNGFQFIASNCANDPYMARNATDVGQWHHFVGVVNGGVRYLYIDGAFVSSSNNSSGCNTWNNNSTLEIARDATPNYYINGLVDDVRVYNRVLSGAEIQALYNLQK